MRAAGVARERHRRKARNPLGRPNYASGIRLSRAVAMAWLWHEERLFRDSRCSSMHRPPMTLPLQQTDVGCQIALARRWVASYKSTVAGIQAQRSRALPWLHVARVVRFGRGIDGEAAHGLIGALRHLAEENPVLRLHIETWSE